MPLENITLIKFQRSEFTGPISLSHRQIPNANDGVIFSLFEQCKHQLSRSSAKQFGVFDPDAENQQFKGLLGLWQNDKKSFIDMANTASEYLQQQLDSTEDPFEATLVFAEETQASEKILICFWLPFVEALQIGQDLEPIRTKIINTSELQFALKIQIDTWQMGNSKEYITLFVQRGNKVCGDAFKRFCNFKESVDLPKQTDEFLQILDTYLDTSDLDTSNPEINENSEKSDSMNQTKKVKLAVISYCVEKDKLGEPILLDEISTQMDKDSPTKFVDFVKNQPQVLPNEIHTDRQSLKRYMRYFGRDQSLSISFSAERFGSDIQYDPISGSLNILKLPKNLKVQLSGYAEKKG